jgi:hypothetical protein
MSWRQCSTLGEEIVKEVHDLLRIDDTYLLDVPDGFVYWAGDLATQVTTDMGLFRQGQSSYKLTATTDLLKGRGHWRDLALALEHEMDDCSFSGPVFDPVEDVFKLYCAVYVTNDQAHWLRRTFAAAVALQIAEAHDMAASFVQRFHATPATSGHPQNGLRAHADDTLTHAYGLFHPSGDAPSRWIGCETWERAGWVMEREAHNFHTDRQTSLNADFDWTATEDGFQHLEVRTDEPHPKLGNGLHITLTVPMRLNPEAIGHLVLDLNSYERAEYKRCHTLGSWCEHDGRLAHRLFFPNALFDNDLLEEACVTMATRAIWVDEWFAEKKRQAMAGA